MKIAVLAAVVLLAACKGDEPPISLASFSGRDPTVAAFIERPRDLSELQICVTESYGGVSDWWALHFGCATGSLSDVVDSDGQILRCRADLNSNRLECSEEK